MTTSSQTVEIHNAPGFLRAKQDTRTALDQIRQFDLGVDAAYATLVHLVFSDDETTRRFHETIESFRARWRLFMTQFRKVDRAINSMHDVLAIRSTGILHMTPQITEHPVYRWLLAISQRPGEDRRVITPNDLQVLCSTING